MLYHNSTRRKCLSSLIAKIYPQVGASLVVGAFADLFSELRGQSGQVLVPSDAVGSSLISISTLYFGGV